ncbi:mate-domain-containing protein [Coemansia spiralis]|nr:mate-domain-containing protein [Coemansia spiralis]
MVLQLSFQVANIVAVSHLGAKKLAAMSFAITSQGIFVFGPIFGLLSAMDTFCSNAYTASHDKTLVGLYLQRGIIAVCAYFALSSPILWNFEKLLLLIGQDPEIAQLTGLYLRINLPGMLPFALFETMKRYLQAQGIMHAATIVLIVVAPISWLSNFLLVRSPTYGVGFIGAPLVNVITNYLTFIVILIYARKSRAIEAWGGWTVSAFYNMSAFYRLAIPSVITVCAESICFELLTVGASYFGANQIAGQLIILNSIRIIVLFSDGLGFGTSPRVGNLIGAAKPRQAHIAGDMAILASSFVGVMGTLFLVLFGDWWVSIYTVDPAVARESAKLIPVACIFIISHGMNVVFSAILRGLGRQKASANSFLFGFYVCAIPLGIYLGYIRHMEALGLWWGVCIGVLVSSTLQIVYVYWWIDWKDEVRLCLLRLNRNSRFS